MVDDCREKIRRPKPNGLRVGGANSLFVCSDSIIDILSSNPDVFPFGSRMLYLVTIGSF